MTNSNSKLISLDELAYELTGRYTASKNEKPEIGVTYVPPMTLSMTASVGDKLISSASKSQVALPKHFSWHKPADVKKYKPEVKDPENVIVKPGNQYTCGSCWAWATSQSLSDRISIATGKNPQLSPSYIISCSLSSSCNRNALAGCSGGQIDIGLNDMAKNGGATPFDCWSYNWCKNNPNCSGGGNEMANNNMLVTSEIPFENNYSTCTENKKPATVYKTFPESAKRLTSIEDIKHQLFTKGPVPTGFFVYKDFLAGSNQKTAPGGSWVATGGVYVHLDTFIQSGGTYATSNGDPMPYKYGDPSVMNTSIGGHAVVIVGWGEETVPNFLPKTHPGKKNLTIPFWWVRNSWGDKWNGDGFFKVAMTEEKSTVNTLLKLDAFNDKVGGPIDFEIETDPVVPKNDPNRHPIFLGPSYKAGTSLNVHTIIIILLVIVAIGIVGLMLYKRTSKSSNII